MYSHLYRVVLSSEISGERRLLMYTIGVRNTRLVNDAAIVHLLWKIIIVTNHVLVKKCFATCKHSCGLNTTDNWENKKLC